MKFNDFVDERLDGVYNILEESYIAEGFLKNMKDKRDQYKLKKKEEKIKRMLSENLIVSSNEILELEKVFYKQRDLIIKILKEEVPGIKVFEGKAKLNVNNLNESYDMYSYSLNICTFISNTNREKFIKTIERDRKDIKVINTLGTVATAAELTARALNALSDKDEEDKKETKKEINDKYKKVEKALNTDDIVNNEFSERIVNTIAAKGGYAYTSTYYNGDYLTLYKNDRELISIYLGSTGKEEITINMEFIVKNN